MSHKNWPLHQSLNTCFRLSFATFTSFRSVWTSLLISSILHSFRWWPCFRHLEQYFGTLSYPTFCYSLISHLLLGFIVSTHYPKFAPLWRILPVYHSEYSTWSFQGDGSDLDPHKSWLYLQSACCSMECPWWREEDKSWCTLACRDYHAPKSNKRPCNWL